MRPERPATASAALRTSARSPIPLGPARRPSSRRRFRLDGPILRPEPSVGPEGRPSRLPRLYPGEPETFRRDPRQFLANWAHLAILLAIVKVFRVEGRALLILLGLAWATLPVHYFLPTRWKRPFFLAVSVVGLFGVFGPAVGLAVVAASAGLVGVTRLPVGWGVRASIVGAVAVAMGAVRGWAIPAGVAPGWVEVALPVLGSMLMFRMIVYLYELRHAKKPEPIVDTLNYFFLLPNYAFLHFPVVDYRTLGRSFGLAEVHATQRAGLRMIFNGVVHLMLYRLVYHDLLISPDQVGDPSSLARFVVANYLLYLQVSGQFHVACGMIHLFGYQLPTTHHHYLLASGFTDYWRRVNIYWKDFMVRVVFNPLAFRWKRRPRWQALGGATLAVFVVTWALHAYQSFWLRGSWGFSAPDALFWGILGILVLVNVQLDALASDRPSGRSRSCRGRSVGSTLAHAARVSATFATLAMLWSLWSSPDLSQWLAMIARAAGR